VSGLGLSGHVCICILLACIRKLEVCIHIQLGCVRRPMYVHIYSCPETLIQVFLVLFPYFIIYASVLTILFVFESLFLCLFTFNMLD